MFPQSSGCINNIPTIAIPLVGWMLQCGMICDTEDLVCVMAVLTAVGCHRVGLVHNDDEVNYVLGIILMGVMKGTSIYTKWCSAPDKILLLLVKSIALPIKLFNDGRAQSPIININIPGVGCSSV